MIGYIVITSINQLTDAVVEFCKFKNWNVILVSDLKSEFIDSSDNLTVLSISDQEKLNLKSIKTTPYNHYCRKNIGYLYAIQRGSEFIYETDDDTFPKSNWNIRNFHTDMVIKGDDFLNVYSLFTDEFVWPRGLHLPYIKVDNKYTTKDGDYDVGVWQGIIDGDSDVDAIYRLTIDKHIEFDTNKEFCVANNTYVPFNTQSTLWNKKFYKLMYLPISVNFRYTDILRSYIAQRIMWEHDFYVGFHSPNTHQIRNKHDYYTDFLNEIQMYQTVPIVIDILQNVTITTDIDSSMLKIYNQLFKSKIVSDYEISNLINWLDDINSIQS